MHAIDANNIAYLVEIDITGLRKCRPNIHFAMPLGFPVTVTVGRVRQHEKATTQGFVRQVGRAGFESRNRQHRFDRRAGRIRATNGAIEKRLSRIVLQRRKLRGRHADGKQVRVKRRRTDQGENFSAPGFDGYHSSALALQSPRREQL